MEATPFSVDSHVQSPFLWVEEVVIPIRPVLIPGRGNVLRIDDQPFFRR